MKKIPTLFIRDEGTHRVTSVPRTDCQWVIDGEGVATRKYDGIAVYIKVTGYGPEGAGGKLTEAFVRKIVKPNSDGGYDFLDGFIDLGFDEDTKQHVGWIPADTSGYAKYISQALDLEPGTLEGSYELVGPKVQGNPERMEFHHLQKHSYAERFPSCPRDYDELRGFLSELKANRNIEGVVWHHPDGRAAKLKASDYGL